MSPPLRLAESLVSRLCHDLSGQLGAIMGATELAAAEQGAEATAFAAETAATLGRRLRLLRAAWGGDGAGLAPTELLALIRSLPGRAVRLDIAGLAPSPQFGPPAARVMLNLLLLASESLPAGGEIRLVGSADTQVALSIAGPRAAWPAGLAGWLADPDSAWAAVDDPRRVQAPLTALLVQAAGLRASLLFAATPADAPPPLLLDLAG